MVRMFSQELVDLIKEYEKLSKSHLLADESTPNTLWFISASGKKMKASPTGIKKYIEYKTGNKPVKIKDFFKVLNPVQTKKQWKAIATSMTLDELTEIDKIMKESNIKTYSKFLRLLLLKVIEANK